MRSLLPIPTQILQIRAQTCDRQGIFPHHKRSSAPTPKRSVVCGLYPGRCETTTRLESYSRAESVDYGHSDPATRAEPMSEVRRSRVPHAGGVHQCTNARKTSWILPFCGMVQETPFSGNTRHFSADLD